MMTSIKKRSPAQRGNAANRANSKSRTRSLPLTADIVNPAERLLSRLDGVRQCGPGKWLSRCPAHDDRSPSLSIREVEDRILIHCFAGCSVDSILAAVGLTTADLFPKPPERIEYGKASPRAPRWNRSELFDLVVIEALILALALGDLLSGKTLSSANKTRVDQAIEAVTRCAREVRHG